MSRHLRLGVATAVAAIGLVGATPSQAATYYGTVGSGTTITLENAAA